MDVDNSIHQNSKKEVESLLCISELAVLSGGFGNIGNPCNETILILASLEGLVLEVVPEEHAASWFWCFPWIMHAS